MILLGALCIACCLAMFFYRRPLLLLFLFPIANLFEIVFPSYWILTSGYMLIPTDAVHFFIITHLTLCALLKPRQMLGILKENVFLSIFLAVVALYVVLYTPINGQSAVGEARKYYAVFLLPIFASLSIR